MADWFRLTFRPAGKPFGAFFVLGGTSDFDEGGFIVGELITNVQLCIAEKTGQIAPFHAKYPEWELVLVNRIDNDLGRRSRTNIWWIAPSLTPI